MKKLMIALVAGMFTVSGAYAGEMKDTKKSDTGMTKSEKGTDKKDAMSKDDDKKKSKKKDEMTK